MGPTSKGKVEKGSGRKRERERMRGRGGGRLLFSYRLAMGLSYYAAASL